MATAILWKKGQQTTAPDEVDSIRITVTAPQNDHRDTVRATFFYDERSGTIAVPDVDTLTVLVEGLDATGTVVYRGVLTVENTDSDYLQVTVEASQVSPLGPTGVTFESISNSAILIEWSDNSSNEDGFIVLRGTEPDQLDTVITVSANQNTYVDTMVEESETYYYQVLAFNSAGESDLHTSLEAITHIPPSEIKPLISAPDSIGIWEGEQFDTIDLNTWVHDSDHSDDQIRWDTEGDSLIQVTVSDERQAIITIESDDLNGIDSILFIARDPLGGCDSHFVAFYIHAVNDTPRILSTPLESAVQDSLYVYDIDAYDPEDDELVYELTTDHEGILLDTQNLRIEWTPTNSDVAGSPYQVALRISEAGEGGLHTEQSWSITVLDKNDYPVAENDSVLVDEDDSLEIAVLTNDSDPDGDDLEIHEIVSEPEHGAVIVLSGMAVRYVPSENFSGDDSFQYEIHDGRGGRSTATVYVSVKEIPDAPVGEPDTYTIDEDSALVVNAAAGVLHNDTDVDSDNLTAVLVENVDTGSLALEANGAFVYTPPDDYFGTVTFTYQAEDEGGELSEVTVCSINIRSVNDAPEFIEPDSVITVSEGERISYTYRTEDEENETALISVIPVSTDTLPYWVNVTGSAQSITITFEPGYEIASGESPQILTLFTLIATDNEDSSEMELRVTVENTNREPQFTNFQSTVSIPIGDSASIQLTGSDPDGDIPSFSVVSGLQGMRVTGDNRLKWYVPREEFVPGDARDVTLRVSDGDTFSDSTFIVEFSPHEWKVRSTTNDENPYYTAQNEDVVYKGVNGNPNITIHKSSDGGQTWSPLTTIMRFDKSGKINMKAGDEGLLLHWYSTNTMMYLSNIEINSGEMDTIRGFGINSPVFYFSPNGKRVIGIQSYMGGVTNMIYKSEISDTMVQIKSFYRPICVGDSITWGQNGHNLFAMPEVELNDSIGGFKKEFYNAGRDYIASDGNDGDTIYTCDTSSASIYRYILNGNYSTRTRDLSIQKIVMVSGEIGWALTTTGEIYFTKDGFVTNYKEVAAIENTTISFTDVFRATDGTMFAVGEDETGKTYLFRY